MLRRSVSIYSTRARGTGEARRDQTYELDGVCYDPHNRGGLVSRLGSRRYGSTKKYNEPPDRDRVNARTLPRESSPPLLLFASSSSTNGVGVRFRNTRKKFTPRRRGPARRGLMASEETKLLDPRAKTGCSEERLQLARA